MAKWCAKPDVSHERGIVVGPLDSAMISINAQLKGLEMSLRNAIVGHTPEALSYLIADEFAGRDSSGKVYSKSDFIDSIHSHPDPTSVIFDFRVRLATRDQALVTFRTKLQGTENAAMKLHISIYLRRENRWQLVYWKCDCQKSTYGDEGVRVLNISHSWSAKSAGSS